MNTGKHSGTASPLAAWRQQQRHVAILVQPLVSGQAFHERLNEPSKPRPTILGEDATERTGGSGDLNALIRLTNLEHKLAMTRGIHSREAVDANRCVLPISQPLGDCAKPRCLLPVKLGEPDGLDGVRS